MSESMTIEQACTILNEKRWRERDDWHVGRINNFYIFSEPSRAASMSYSGINAIAIANSFVLADRVAELETLATNLDEGLKNTLTSHEQLLGELAAAKDEIASKNRLLPSLIQEDKQIAEQRLDELEQRHASLVKAARFTLTTPGMIKGRDELAAAVEGQP